MTDPIMSLNGLKTLRKHRKDWVPAFTPFHIMFPKGLPQVLRNSELCGKGLKCGTVKGEVKGQPAIIITELFLLFCSIDFGCPLSCFVVY